MNRHTQAASPATARADAAPPRAVAGLSNLSLAGNVSMVFGVLAAALLLATGPAFAQSDYQRGYREGFDQGFKQGYDRAMREGSAAAPGNAAPGYAPGYAVPAAPVPKRGIIVTRAWYGDGSRSCNLTGWAARHFNNRTSQSVAVTNNICGDPAPGQRKELVVEYMCGAETKRESAYEHRNLSISCY